MAYGKIGLKDMKEINKKALLKVIFSKGSCSRTELNEYTSLGNSTITQLIDELIRAGLVKETSVGASSGGRRPVMLSLAGNGGYEIIINLSHDRISMNLYDFLLEKIDCVEKSVDMEVLARNLYDILCNEINQILINNNITTNKLVGIGINSSVFEELKMGSILIENSTLPDAIPLDEALKIKYKTNVIIEPEIAARGIAEKYFGFLNTNKGFVLIDIGDEINAIIIDSALDATRIVNLDHFVINPEGKKCECGKKGCLNTFIPDSNYPVVQNKADMISGEFAVFFNALEILMNNIKQLFGFNTFVLSGEFIERYGFEEVIPTELTMVSKKSKEIYFKRSTMDINAEYRALARVLLESYLSGRNNIRI